MRIPFVYTLEALARTYINLRIFAASFLLTILVVGLWLAERSIENQFYCEEGEECYTFVISYQNPFGNDYISQTDYELLPYKVAFLYDEGKRRKVGDAWFDKKGEGFEAFFEVPMGEYTLRIDREDAVPIQTFQIKEDLEFILPFKKPLEESNLLLDATIKNMKAKEKNEN